MEAQRGEPIIRQAAWDSAGACISVQEQCSHGVAVLATTQAARSAGLHILVDGIHDADADVNARFLILGRIGCAMISPCPRAASRIRAERKTTLLASVHNEPECLSSILRVFADAGVAVLAIQTRLLAPWSTSRYVHGASKAITTIGYAHTIDAMEAVVRREVQYCVVPSNWLLSISASFALTKFSLFPLCIAAEIFCKPPLCLSAVAGTELHDAGASCQMRPCCRPTKR
jgi:prephenate dehydratase